MTKLSDEIRERHRSSKWHSRCDGCNQHFPCDFLRVADELDAKDKLLDEARKLAQSCPHACVPPCPHTERWAAFLTKLKEADRGD